MKYAVNTDNTPTSFFSCGKVGVQAGSVRHGDYSPEYDNNLLTNRHIDQSNYNTYNFMPYVLDYNNIID